MSPLGQIYDPHGSWWGTVHPGLASVGMDGLQQKLSIWVKITICRLHKGTFTMWLEPAVSLQRLFSKDTVVQPPCQSTNQNEGNQETEIWRKLPPHVPENIQHFKGKEIPERMWELLFHLGGKKHILGLNIEVPGKKGPKLYFVFFLFSSPLTLSLNPVVGKFTTF